MLAAFNDDRLSQEAADQLDAMLQDEEIPVHAGSPLPDVILGITELLHRLNRYNRCKNVRYQSDRKNSKA